MNPAQHTAQLLLASHARHNQPAGKGLLRSDASFNGAMQPGDADWDQMLLTRTTANKAITVAGDRVSQGQDVPAPTDGQPPLPGMLRPPAATAAAAVAAAEQEKIGSALAKAASVAATIVTQLDTADQAGLPGLTLYELTNLVRQQDLPAALFATTFELVRALVGHHRVIMRLAGRPLTQEQGPLDVARALDAAADAKLASTVQVRHLLAPAVIEWYVSCKGNAIRAGRTSAATQCENLQSVFKLLQLSEVTATLGPIAAHHTAQLAANALALWGGRGAQVAAQAVNKQVPLAATAAAAAAAAAHADPGEGAEEDQLPMLAVAAAAAAMALKEEEGFGSIHTNLTAVAAVVVAQLDTADQAGLPGLTLYELVWRHLQGLPAALFSNTAQLVRALVQHRHVIMLLAGRPLPQPQGLRDAAKLASADQVRHLLAPAVIEWYVHCTGNAIRAARFSAAEQCDIMRSGFKLLQLPEVAATLGPVAAHHTAQLAANALTLWGGRGAQGAAQAVNKQVPPPPAAAAAAAAAAPMAAAAAAAACTGPGVRQDPQGAMPTSRAAGAGAEAVPLQVTDVLAQQTAAGQYGLVPSEQLPSGAAFTRKRAWSETSHTAATLLVAGTDIPVVGVPDRVAALATEATAGKTALSTAAANATRLQAQQRSTENLHAAVQEKQQQQSLTEVARMSRAAGSSWVVLPILEREGNMGTAQQQTDAMRPGPPQGSRYEAGQASAPGAGVVPVVAAASTAPASAAGALHGSTHVSQQQEARAHTHGQQQQQSGTMKGPAVPREGAPDMLTQSQIMLLKANYSAFSRQAPRNVSQLDHLIICVSTALGASCTAAQRTQSHSTEFQSFALVFEGMPCPGQLQPYSFVSFVGSSGELVTWSMATQCSMGCQPATVLTVAVGTQDKKLVRSLTRMSCIWLLVVIWSLSTVQPQDAAWRQLRDWAGAAGAGAQQVA